jgi:hypothetical protein
MPGELKFEEEAEPYDIGYAHGYTGSESVAWRLGDPELDEYRHGYAKGAADKDAGRPPHKERENG